MAKPNQPKDVKPKTDEGASKSPIDGNMKMVVINLATTVLICVLFLSVNYVLQSSLLSSKLSQTMANASNTDENADSNADTGDEVQKGIILDLGDFILNLSDANPRKYLKANVALEVSRAANDPDMTQEASSKEGGSKEGKEAAPSDPIAVEMEQYK